MHFCLMHAVGVMVDLDGWVIILGTVRKALSRVQMHKCKNPVVMGQCTDYSTVLLQWSVVCICVH